VYRIRFLIKKRYYGEINGGFLSFYEKGKEKENGFIKRL
jgi:hypothetical protein